MTIGRKIQTLSNDETLSEIPPLYYAVERPDICRGVWFPGVTSARSIANRLSSAAPDLSVVGNPTIEATHVAINSTVDYLDSGEVDTAEITVMVVVRLHAKPTAFGEYARFYGNLGANHGLSIHMAVSNIEASVYYDNAGVTELKTATLSTGGGGQAFDAVPFPFRCLAAQFSDAGVTLWDFTTARKATVAASVGVTRRIQSDPMTFGAGLGKSGSGDFDVACGIRWNGSPTEAELQAQYDRLEALYAEIGITV